MIPCCGDVDGLGSGSGFGCDADGLGFGCGFCGRHRGLCVPENVTTRTKRTNYYCYCCCCYCCCCSGICKMRVGLEFRHFKSKNRKVVDLPATTFASVVVSAGGSRGFLIVGVFSYILLFTPEMDYSLFMCLLLFKLPFVF